MSIKTEINIAGAEEFSGAVNRFDADGGRLPENGGDESIYSINLCQERQFRAQAVLLHDHGREGRVQGAELEGRIDEPG